jgi:putative effector of murein hydrolase
MQLRSHEGMVELGCEERVVLTRVRTHSRCVGRGAASHATGTARHRGAHTQTRLLLCGAICTLLAVAARL